MIASTARIAYLVLGWLCVGLGIVGVAVPGLPTTPFMLVAVWAFSKSSERFRIWLLTHKRFGPPVAAWQAHGVIAPRAKVFALIAMGTSIVVIVLFAKLHWLAVTGIVLVICGAAIFVATRPGYPPA